MGFYLKDQIEFKQVDHNTKRKVLAHDHNLMMVEIHFAEPTEEADLVPHSHPHEQMTYVLQGKLKFFIDDKSHEVQAGDSLYFPSRVMHGCVVLEPDTRLLDVFTPIREDFLEQ
jgi:quercetin dioxygenase-like cupin family protein